jgi:hypothetical protein
MPIRFHFSTVFASAVLVSTFLACSSADPAPEPTPQEKFSQALSGAYSKCSGKAGASSSCEKSLNADATKVAGLLSASVLDGASTCMKSTACGTDPLTCLGTAVGSATTSAAQTKLATDYCESCSSVGGEACTTAFFGTADVPGVAFLLLPFGDGPLTEVDSSCTKNPLGKTACQAAFTACLSATATKFLATSVSADSAKCLVEGIRPKS